MLTLVGYAQYPITSINITMPANPPANTVDWATALPPVMISLNAALNFLNNLLHRPALVFVLSDFHDHDEAAWQRALKASNQRHEMIALRTVDQRELELPDVGLALVQDAETGEVIELDTGDPAVRAAYAAAGEKRLADLKVFCRLSGVPELDIRTDTKEAAWPQRLQKFLDQAAKRRVA